MSFCLDAPSIKVCPSLIHPPTDRFLVAAKVKQKGEARDDAAFYTEQNP